MQSPKTPKILAVIPARYASTRIPGKMIASLAGKPLVYHTYLRAREAALVHDVVVAIDDARVQDALAPYGVPTIMTRVDHVCGTDRIAEVAERMDADILVNVQGDEPLIDPKTIDAAIQPLLDYPEVPMATARRRIDDPETVKDPNVVKVVCDMNGRALYFSRCPIPYIRDQKPGSAESGPGSHWQHIGLYVYRRDFLLAFSRWAPTPLEQWEKLEQLRVLEHGHPIAVVETQYASIGVDTPEDLVRVNQLLAGE